MTEAVKRGQGKTSQETIETALALVPLLFAGIIVALIVWCIS